MLMIVILCVFLCFIPTFKSISNPRYPWVWVCAVHGTRKLVVLGLEIAALQNPAERSGDGSVTRGGRWHIRSDGQPPSFFWGGEDAKVSDTGWSWAVGHSMASATDNCIVQSPTSQKNMLPRAWLSLVSLYVCPQRVLSPGASGAE